MDLSLLRVTSGASSSPVLGAAKTQAMAKLLSPFVGKFLI
jgi:hypothetical protein